MATTEGLHPTLMRPRVEALLRDPEAVARGVWIVSGFRSVERQSVLYADAVANCRRNPAKCPPSRWVARPGTSNHGPKVDGFGTAVDFGIRGVRANSAGQWPTAVDAWFQALAARHGLEKGMDWEDWHYEPKRDWQGQPEEELDMDENRLREIVKEEVGSNGLRLIDAIDDLVAKRLKDIEKELTDDSDNEGTVASRTRRALKNLRELRDEIQALKK